MIFDKESLVELIELNLQSYNSNIKWGSSIAIGIAFASSGSTIAHELLKPLLTDKEGLVKQGAYIAMAMVFNN